MKLVKDHFSAWNGLLRGLYSKVESEKRLRRYKIEGLDILQKAVKKNHGVPIECSFYHVGGQCIHRRKSIAPGIPGKGWMYR
ncbi:MAG: hypothetical protein Ct9H90mP13_05580 [Pseudomonadota bacterium]|nr:MAG: hypothetical protein Ct9H90mP13_05580 [Pseudomonadota bacterium]